MLLVRSKMQLVTMNTRTPPHPMSIPSVSIIIVNYNGAAHLSECLDSLAAQQYRDYEVLVVDNNSNDGSPEIVREHFPDVGLIYSPDNLGYSGAVNLALSKAVGRYIAVLNMDAMVAPDWLEPLVTQLDTDPQVGAVTPKILLYHDPERINALGQNVHITALGFNRAYNHPDQPGMKPFKVSGLHGAAFLIRRDLLDRMGGMNKDCFLYHEDVDLSWLVQLMGYDIFCVPASTVRHKYVLKMDTQKLFYLERNRVAMLLTNLGWWTLLLILPFLLLTELMMASYCFIKGPSFVQAKLRSFGWIWQRRGHIRERRNLVRSLRHRSDWQVIAGLHLMYEWDQLVTLGKQQHVVKYRSLGRNSA